MKPTNRMWRPVVGGFVWTQDRLGIGKLAELSGNDSQVEFTHSAARVELRPYALQDLRRAYLPLQTRVYHSRGVRLLLGRVLDRFVVGGDEPASYLIRFPGYKPLEMPEVDLRVRCLLPVADPTEVLAAGAAEAQYLADRRTGVLEQLVDARRTGRSLGGLISASVELLPHQVEIVRRVTEDPVQRYLLADEVGLGKTIEAAAVIAQAVLDDPNARIAIVAPSSLSRQWQRELHQRFGISAGDRLRIVPFERLSTIDENEVDFLVIDEVHHLISPDRGVWTATGQYRELQRLAHNVPRLLLLSATPVLGDSGATLALLNLLDEDRYRLDERSTFELLLSNRQEFGRLLLSINADSAPIVLRRAMNKLRELVPDDALAAQLSGRLLSALEEDDRTQVPALVRGLRDHISETYRINRRLLRTRRRDIEGWELKSREAQVLVEVDEDDRVYSAADALEEWRYRASLFVLDDNGGGIGDGPKRERDLLTRFVELFNALGCGVDPFVETFTRQWQSVAQHEASTFPEEGEIFRRVASLKDASNEGTDRDQLGAGIVDLALRGTVARNGSSSAKVVVFGGTSTFAKRVAVCLQDLRGVGVSFIVTGDMDEDAVDGAVRQFQAAGAPAALICDRSGEEGLNLQFADAIVHLDLPLDPLRVEQRIGRLDRIGRDSGLIRHRLLLPSDEETSPWLAWFEVLRDGLHVFDETIADVQFVLEQILESAQRALFRDGTDGLRKFVTRSRELVVNERRRLDEQYALDRLEMGESDGHILFDQLAEAEGKDRRLASSMSGWWHDVLRLDLSPLDDAPDVFLYSWTDRTLAPREPWEALVRAALETPVTFDRGVALRRIGTRLIRTGNPLVESLRRFLRYDDRGTAFATWRMEPAWTGNDHGTWIGFKLIYVVELDAEEIAASLWEVPDPSRIAALQRQADLLFQPWIQTYFVDAALMPVTDTSLRAILMRPYEKQESRPGQRDFNLSSRPGALASVMDPVTLAGLCEEIRDKAPTMVRDEPRFERHLGEARGRAEADLSVRVKRLERRRAAQAREDPSEEAGLDLEIAVAQALRREVESPAVRLDSVGLIIVTSDSPPVATA